jgi:hypothetical protein
MIKRKRSWCFWKDFCSDLPFPSLAEDIKHSSKISPELHLLRWEVIEEETLNWREREQSKKKNKENKERDKEQRAWFEKNNK